jgi:sec-independent protein translocase protein TatA
MPFRMGPWEIGLILIVIMFVFGVGKLPQVGSAIGKSIRGFRKEQSGEGDEAEVKTGRQKKKYAARTNS